MTWGSYGAYLAFALVVVVLPGQDFALTVRNSLGGGFRSGVLTSAGIATSNVVQGSAAALGLGAVIAHSQVAFNAIRWAGVAYLCWLGLQALRSAVKGNYATLTHPGEHGHQVASFRQGFLSNITNPKVLTLYLSVLPQFLGHASVVGALTLAYTHVVLGLAWSLTLVLFLHQLRLWLQRRPIRRALDALTGCALLAFGAKLAAESQR
ncbi:MAG: LysE family translocator [Pseudonocardiaceae bacterium]|nr:LysE family translocator [Pseudonocardiaceae bacterium]